MAKIGRQIAIVRPLERTLLLGSISIRVVLRKVVVFSANRLKDRYIQDRYIHRKRNRERVSRFTQITRLDLTTLFSKEMLFGVKTLQKLDLNSNSKIKIQIRI